MSVGDGEHGNGRDDRDRGLFRLASDSSELREHEMKQKVGVLLEDEILRRARRQAAEERRSLSDLVQDAVESYLASRLGESGKRGAAYELFCQRPMRLTPEQLRTVLDDWMPLSWMRGFPAFAWAPPDGREPC
jgi:hypothetical protein